MNPTHSPSTSTCAVWPECMNGSLPARNSGTKPLARMTASTSALSSEKPSDLSPVGERLSVPLKAIPAKCSGSFPARNTRPCSKALTGSRHPDDTAAFKPINSPGSRVVLIAIWSRLIGLAIVSGFARGSSSLRRNFFGKSSGRKL